MDALSHHIEKIILQFNNRGMVPLSHKMPAGYCRRAARLIHTNKGTVLIGTGFPVKGSFETDGPIGAMAIYRVLEHLGYDPVFVCGPPLSRIFDDGIKTYEIPILEWQDSMPVVQEALDKLQPTLMLSVERPGITAEGYYCNMRGQDISAFTAKFDLFFDLGTCPTIAFGDGGNEIGMGNVQHLLTELPIKPSVTTCDELVIATVSNWGVYGVIAELSDLVGQDLFACFDPQSIVSYLMANGSLDGVTTEATPSEDGFPMAVGDQIIQQLRGALSINQPENPMPD
jgi:D-glutamate cyclase-like, C-terminal